MLNIADQLANLDQQHLLRQRRVINHCVDKHYRVDHQQLINFASNDYLGLSQDPRVRAALIKATFEFGVGSGSSAMISGFSRYHHELEEAFADFLGRERALFFNSGYHANLGVITSFADRHTAVIADKYCHASIIDAIILSRASHYRFRHNDINHARTLLSKQVHQQKLLITESVYGMSGAITPIDEFAEIAKPHVATFIVDDAHGFGVLGKKWSSTAVPIWVIPLGKALGGMGAIVAGDYDNIEFLVQKARSYCYSTALPPAICSANLQALQIIRTEPERLAQLQHLITYFNQQAAMRNIPLISADMTPIKCVLCDSNQTALALQQKLADYGFFVAAIRPPTVPENHSRLRISLTVQHSQADIADLLNVLAEHYASP